MARERFDVVVIGAGAAGLMAAIEAGRRGRSVTDSAWTRLLDRTPAELTDLLGEASRQGWLTYKAAGAVVEVTFPGLLKSHEEEAARDAD